MQGIVEYLEHYCEEITPREFYRKIFPEGELDVKGEFNKGKYIGVALSIAQKKICRYSVTDDLDIIDELCGSDDFCIMSPISYAGKSRESKNARFLYALAFDLDGIRMRELEGWPSGMVNLFYQFDGNGPSNYLPKPTMIVYSGGGLHLYYVFEKAIPCFPILWVSWINTGAGLPGSSGRRVCPICRMLCSMKACSRGSVCRGRLQNRGSAPGLFW